MPKAISANRLADGIVVYVGHDGAWCERLSEAKIFASKAEAEAGLVLAQIDAKRNLVVEPVVFEVTGEASGLHAVTLREAIRARGPTIDFLPRTHAFAHGADPPPENTAKQATKRFCGFHDWRTHESMILESMNFKTAAAFPVAR